MKGVILAGGTGSRLRPITDTGPKQLVPIANKPVLEYALDDLTDAGIDEIGIILGDKGRRKIQRHFGDGTAFGVDITYIVQGEPLGLAHAIGCARDFVGGDPFVVYLGDDMMNERIEDLVADFDPDLYSAGIGLQEVDEPSRYGVVACNELGDVMELVEKLENPPSNLALIGVYVFTPQIFEQIEKLVPSWRGELEITEAIQGLLDDGQRVQSHVVHGWWKDTGKPGDVLHANRLVLDDLESDIQGTVMKGASVTGRVEIDSGTTIEDGAVIRGPVSIGKNTTIGSDAYVGPYTSIGDGCEINNVHVEETVLIGDNLITADRKIVDSLIGREASITTNKDKQPTGDRLVIGQNSALEL